jgi:nicotinate-nucleotide adenylyltransferase
MIGVFGGTFDPIHFGHLRLAQEIADGIGLDAVRFLPTGNPWHRDAPRASAGHRLAMTRLACAGNPRFVVDGREADGLLPGYTVETLGSLRDELPATTPVCLLMGADAFLGLDRWHRWRALFDLAHVVVARRPGFPLPADHPGLPSSLARVWTERACEDAALLRNAPAGRIYVQTITALDISATRIRADLAAGKSPRYLLPDAVLDYIRRNRLYDAQPEQ